MLLTFRKWLGSSLFSLLTYLLLGQVDLLLPYNTNAHQINDGNGPPKQEKQRQLSTDVNSFVFFTVGDKQTSKTLISRFPCTIIRLSRVSPTKVSTKSGWKRSLLSQQQRASRRTFRMRMTVALIAVRRKWRTKLNEHFKNEELQLFL